MKATCLPASAVFFSIKALIAALANATARVPIAQPIPPAYALALPCSGLWPAVVLADPLDHWTLRNSWPTSFNALTGVACGNGRFVTVGGSSSAATILTSTNGINWTSRTAGVNDLLSSVAYGNR